MSSAANHRKRSHRSENLKAGVYNTSRRRALYREAREQHNQNVFGRLASLFRRKAMRQKQTREAAQA